jgi:hypothetical protein
MGKTGVLNDDEQELQSDLRSGGVLVFPRDDAANRGRPNYPNAGWMSLVSTPRLSAVVDSRETPKSRGVVGCSKTNVRGRCLVFVVVRMGFLGGLCQDAGR